jgi:FkbM family methyltransferase
MIDFRTTYIAPVSMKIIKFSRKHFLNTWVYRLPFTEWVYKKVFYAGRVKAEEEIIFHGKKLLVHTKDITMVPALINQNFEEYEIKLFKKLLKKDMTVLDIGANIGIYSVFASSIIGDGGKIFAFEPVPENYKMLVHNLSINKISNVLTFNNAIGAKSGSVEISIVKDSLATHYIGKKSSNSITVDVINVDSFVKKNKIKVDFIKMDIEGYEGFAIEGAKKTLANKNLILMTEFSAEFITRSGKDPNKVAKTLLEIFDFCYSINELKHTCTSITGVSGLLSKENNNFILSHSELDI